MNRYSVIVRPIVTEKGVEKKESERTLCFEVHPDANKTEIKQAVEGLFKVKVEDVRTLTSRASSGGGAAIRPTSPTGRRPSLS